MSFKKIYNRLVRLARPFKGRVQKCIQINYIYIYYQWEVPWDSSFFIHNSKKLKLATMMIVSFFLWPIEKGLRDNFLTVGPRGWSLTDKMILIQIWIQICIHTLKNLFEFMQKNEFMIIGNLLFFKPSQISPLTFLS